MSCFTTSGSLFLTFVNELRHDSRIVFDHDFGCVVLAVDRKLHLISAGFEWRAGVEKPAEAASATTTSPAATSTECWKIRGTRRRISAHIPLNAIDADVFRGDKVPHNFAGVIADRDLHVAGWRRL